MSARLLRFDPIRPRATTSAQRLRTFVRAYRALDADDQNLVMAWMNVLQQVQEERQRRDRPKGGADVHV